MEKTKVFVSSTCYDLSQIRRNIEEYLATCGFEAVLSDTDSFPINPGADTVNNCIEVVSKKADVFILIVGKKSGYLLEEGISITNKEYNVARQKGIPIYVFLDKELAFMYQLWKKEDGIDLSKHIDHPEKLMLFVSGLHEDAWVSQFDSSDSIIRILKTQLSYLFRDALNSHYKLSKLNHFTFRNELSTRALKLIVEKHDGFEFLFPFQIMSDELHKLRGVKKEYDYDILLHSPSDADDDSMFTKWMSLKLHEINMLVKSFGKLTNESLVYALRPTGVPSDIEELYYVGKSYGKLANRLLQWSQEVRSSHVDEENIELINSLSNLPEKVVSDIWEFPDKTLKTLKEEFDVKRGEDEQCEIHIELNLSIPDNLLHKYNMLFEEFRGRVFNS